MRCVCLNNYPIAFKIARQLAGFGVDVESINIPISAQFTTCSDNLRNTVPDLDLYMYIETHTNPFKLMGGGSFRSYLPFYFISKMLSNIRSNKDWYEDFNTVCINDITKTTPSIKECIKTIDVLASKISNPSYIEYIFVSSYKSALHVQIGLAMHLRSKFFKNAKIVFGGGIYGDPLMDDVFKLFDIWYYRFGIESLLTLLKHPINKSSFDIKFELSKNTFLYKQPFIYIDFHSNCVNQCKYCCSSSPHKQFNRIDPLIASQTVNDISSNTDIIKWQNIIHTKLGIRFTDPELNSSKDWIYTFFSNLTNNTVSLDFFLMFNNLDKEVINVMKGKNIDKIYFGFDILDNNLKHIYNRTTSDNLSVLEKINILKQISTVTNTLSVYHVSNVPGTTDEIFNHNIESCKELISSIPNIEIIYADYYLDDNSYMYFHPNEFGITYTYWEPINYDNIDDFNAIICKIPKYYYHDVPTTKQKERYSRWLSVIEEN